MMVTIPLHLRIVVYGDIQSKILQWLASSFYTGDIEVTLSFLSEVRGKAYKVAGGLNSDFFFLLNW